MDQSWEDAGQPRRVSRRPSSRAATTENVLRQGLLVQPNLIVLVDALQRTLCAINERGKVLARAALVRKAILKIGGEKISAKHHRRTSRPKSVQ